MKRYVAAVGMALIVLTSLALAQQSGSGLADNSPTENNALGNITARGPSTWVDAARLRHQQLIDARVNTPRGGGVAGTLEGLDGSGSGSSTSTSDLGSLLDLVTQLGGTSDLSGLLDAVTTGGTTTTGTTTGTSGSGMTIADLLALRDSLLGGNSKEIDRSQSVAATQSYETRDGSGAIGRLPKIEPRAQSSTTDDRKFVVRWADRMVQTVFTALSVGFNSSAFIDFLKDGLRPIMFPPAQTSEDGGDGGDGSDTGGGIEDLNPSGGGGDSGSIV